MLLQCNGDVCPPLQVFDNSLVLQGGEAKSNNLLEFWHQRPLLFRGGLSTHGSALLYRVFASPRALLDFVEFFWKADVAMFSRSCSDGVT